MRQKRSHIGCLFWVALILLVVVIFLFNRPKIDQVLKSTGLSNLVSKQTTEPALPTITRTSPKPELPSGAGPRANPGSPQTPGQPEKTRPPSSSPASNTPSQNKTTSQRQPVSKQDTGPNVKSPASSQSPQKVITQQFQLYFVKIGAAGRPVLAPVSEKINFVDDPLTKTFESLLQGVTAGGHSDGLRSLIPDGTKLLSATVRNGTAYLDFNDRFRFNSYGVEGYNVQLEQVVYTATQFQTVKRVQILLDGKIRRFLASEGVSIDKPLERSSFTG